MVKLLEDMYSDLKAGLSIGVLFFFRQNVSIRADTVMLWCFAVSKQVRESGKKKHDPEKFVLDGPEDSDVMLFCS